MPKTTFLRVVLQLVFFWLALTVGTPVGAQQGFYRIAERGGVWWFIDPSGTPTLSIGVDHIAYESDRIQGSGACPYQEALDKVYPDRAAWGRATLARVREWGFNTIGAWSDRELWGRDPRRPGGRRRLRKHLCV
jgi:hypothetical protein